MLHMASKCKEPKYLYFCHDSTAKALFFGKELGCKDFHLSDGSLDRWKKKKVSLKTVSGIIYKNQYLEPFLS